MLHFSLRTKFLLVMTAVVVASIVIFTTIAVHLFEEDKISYIYEGSATIANSLAAETESNLLSIKKTMEIMALAYIQSQHNTQKQKLPLRLMREDPNIVELNIYHHPLGLLELIKKPRIVFRSYKKEFLKPYDLDERFFARVNQLRPFPLKQAIHQPLFIMNASIPQGMPLLKMSIPYSSRPQEKGFYDYLIVATLRQDNKMALFAKKDSFTKYLIDSYGNILIHKDAQNILNQKNIATSQIFQVIKESPLSSGVRTLLDPERKEPSIYAYSKIKTGNLAIISEIPRSKALAALYGLVRTSILTALLIISISFMISIVFSRSITASLHKLFLGAQRIAQGDFSTQVFVKSRDEVGALAWAFNQMAGEIQRLMAATADKARMEKELETAQLVQDNFFPIDYVEIDDYEVAAFYTPASECGGDWWGHISLDHELILLIGDATGHGVPSALITAAAQSCCTTIERLKRDFPQLELTPDLILKMLNEAIYRAGRGTVKMTFFVAIINRETGAIRYANASHDMPMLTHVPDDETQKITKKNIEICKGKTGMILGHDLSSTYPIHETSIRPGDSLVLFTDGILECKNEQDQMFGKGRFLRTLCSVAAEDARGMRDKIIQTCFDFYGKRERDDDVTLVVLKRKKIAKTLQQAS